MEDFFIAHEIYSEVESYEERVSQKVLKKKQREEMGFLEGFLYQMKILKVLLFLKLEVFWISLVSLVFLFSVL